MMEGVKYLFVVVLFVGAVRSQQTFQEVVPNDLSNPDRCYDRTIDAFFSVGSVWWRPAQCNRLTCQRSDDVAFLNINGVRCEQFTDVPANCKVTKANLVALFPACCPKLVCAEIPTDAITPVDVAENKPMDMDVKEPSPMNEEATDESMKPVMTDDKPMQVANEEMGAQEATENMNENVKPDMMAEEPAVVLALNPGEEVIPATLTVNVADEMKPEESSESQENVNEEVKEPAAMDEETKIPDSVVEETKQPEAVAEEANVPETMAEESKVPEAMAEETRIPEAMAEETKVPEAMDEETKVPETMAEEAKVPEVMDEETKVPEAMAEEIKVPEVMAEETKVPEAIVEETKVPEVMAEETKVPEAIVEETKVPEEMDEETKIPEVMDEEPKQPKPIIEELQITEAAAEEPMTPEAMAEEIKEPVVTDEEKKPEVTEEEKPSAMQEKPEIPDKEIVAVSENPMPAEVAPSAAPDKLSEPMPIYNGGVGVGMKCGPPTYISCSSYLECRKNICQYPIKVIPTQNEQLNAEVPVKEDAVVDNVAEKPVKEVMAATEEKDEEVPQTTQETTTVTEEKPLLPGYERHSTGNYKFNKRMVTWTRAKAICEAEGAHLAIVNSDEESKVLVKMFDRYPENYWQPKYRKIVFASIGFNDMEKEGDYKTIFGDPLSSTGFQRFWRKNEPNNLGASKSRPGEDCGAIHRNGGLNDFFCALHLPFICEQ